jgi:hypothetical protein
MDERCNETSILTLGNKKLTKQKKKYSGSFHASFLAARPHWLSRVGRE